MIIEIRLKNYLAFNEKVVFSMKADMRNKKFATNVVNVNRFNVLKTAGIYGQNNSGKTCFIRSINTIKNILLNNKVEFLKNIFTDEDITELGVTFLDFDQKYSYDIKLNEKNEYVYEKFSVINKDSYNNESEEVWLYKDFINNKFDCLDKEAIPLIQMVSKSNLLCYVIDSSMFPHLTSLKTIISRFADKIDVVDMNNIPIRKTIDIMKNKNQLQDKVVDFIKNADLYLQNYEYLPAEDVTIGVIEDGKPMEKVLDIPEMVLEQIRLVSTYKGVKVPSLIFDSTGTKKIAALASYVIEALENGKILIVDELDSSIHFKLTRAIVNMFNNELNRNAQLIFSVHDINLMDCKKMFRKEQLWFVHKDDERVYMYSLADFTAQDGVRDTTDIIEKYKKGLLGSLPEPHLIDTLLDISINKGAR